MDADDVRLAGLAARCEELTARNKVLWIRVAQAQANEERFLWLLAWWDRRPQNISEYSAAELPAVIDAYRRGEKPPPSRRSKFDEWKPDEGRGALRNFVGSLFNKE